MFDLIDSGLDFLGDAFSGLGDSIVGGILSALDSFLGKILYYITNAIMYLVSILQSLFNVFAGITKVQNDGTKQYLINVFFSNSSINNVYWAMALLGMTFVIAFTIVAVIRKTFDLNDKRQNQSMGTILGGMFKSILIMLLLTAIMSACLSLSNEVIHRVSYIFDNADSFDQEDEIHFTDEQFATMARIFKTIGNYSLNPSYGTRYNLNSCYNELRPDLLYLQQQGVFDLVYVSKDPETGAVIDTWQSVLQELAYASDVNRELNINVYHEEVSDVLLRIMEILRTNRSFSPLEEYGKSYVANNSVGLDRILFLTGTTNSARNQSYNINPHMTDGLRGAFYIGDKSIYKFDDVNAAFDTGITGINYILIWVLAYFTLRNLLRCIFACISRIFNMVSLYVIAPLTIATMPLDDGEKFKQWTTSMIVQGLVIFGNIIPMRLIILFAPIILGPKLVLFESTSLNFIAKALLIVGGLEAVEGFSQIVTGILANSAGMAAINAGNRMQNMSDSMFNTGVGAAKTAGKAAAKVGWGATKLGAKAAVYAGGAAVVGGLAAAGLAVGGVGAGLYHGARGIGYGVGKMYKYFSDKKANSGGGSEPAMGPASMGFQKPTESSGQSIEMQDLSNLGNKQDMEKLGNAVQNVSEGNVSISDVATIAQSMPKVAEAVNQMEKDGVDVPEMAGQMMGGNTRPNPQNSTLNYSMPGTPVAAGTDPLSVMAGGGNPQFNFSKPSPPSGSTQPAPQSAPQPAPQPAPQSAPQPTSKSSPTTAMPGTRVKAGMDPLSQLAKANKTPPPPHNYNKH